MNEPLKQEKKLSSNIERGKHDVMTWANDYVYKFKCQHYLESIDDMSSISKYTHNEFKQMVIDQLANEFKIVLNQVVFGDPAGKDYIESEYYEK